MYLNRLIGLVGRVFANVPGNLGSFLGHVIQKTFKMVHDTSLLNTQHYKLRIKGKKSLSVVAIEKGAFWSPSTTVANYTLQLVMYSPSALRIAVIILG